MKILIAEKISPAALKVFRDEPEFEIVTSEQIGEVMTAVRDADALVVRSATDVNAKLIDAAQKLRVIGRAGVGVDNVDTEAATRKGIVVMNTPGANAIAVAERASGRKNRCKGLSCGAKLWVSLDWEGLGWKSLAGPRLSP